MRTLHRPCRAFTLIELLIVVAIIAIIAAIAVPNFLEAQTRSKVSRVKADQRTLSVAVDAYAVDWNIYPMTSSGTLDLTGTDPTYRAVKAYRALSTPVAYVTQARLDDPFRVKSESSQVTLDSQTYQIASGNANEPLVNAVQMAANMGAGRFGPRNVYAVVSFGPNGVDETTIAEYPFSAGIPYDPTNGTSSAGDIFRCGPGDNVPRGWRGLGVVPAF